MGREQTQGSKMANKQSRLRPEYCDFGPLVNEQQIKAIEKNYASLPVTRRMCLALLSQSKCKLVAMCRDDAELFQYCCSQLEDWICLLNNQKEMAITALTRLTIANDCVKENKA